MFVVEGWREGWGEHEYADDSGDDSSCVNGTSLAFPRKTWPIKGSQRAVDASGAGARSCSGNKDMISDARVSSRISFFSRSAKSTVFGGLESVGDTCI